METIELTVLDLDIMVDVHERPWYVPAKLNGLPEDCYPEEGGEAEWCLNEDNNDFVIIASECTKIEEEIDKAVNAYYEE